MNAETPPFAPIETDCVIIGAGPIGLFQVFELGLLEIRAHVVDSLARLGGQCIELYPEKPIYDIPSVPVCTGRELTENLLRQIERFNPTFHLGQEVTVVRQRDDGRFHVETSNHTTFITKTISIAAGVGAFQPRKLKVEGIDAFEDKQLFYRVKDSHMFDGRQVVVCGGGDSALDCALDFVGKAESVVLVHRRDAFRAAPVSVARMRQLCACYEMQCEIGQVTGFDARDDRLTALKIAGGDGVTRRLELDCLLVFYGLSPKLGPIAEWGLEIGRKQIVVDTARFETSTPGIFAVGDINSYPGKRKLIVSGFHEATLAAFAAAEYVYPGKTIHTQYSTTSPTLHKVLGIESTLAV
ncbi:NAD(P)/FAD-dependent oxidoreductase [Paraburkholderia sp. RL18-103-BIB-C]|jgi:thioredoxin reductase (NADPH)|uniref:NAD(P)/FAD-dependent oxidoreductase n=1 Tax=unclassified Paraburkholderia TaxID=2615204 RepID=UPI0038BADF82